MIVSMFYQNKIGFLEKTPPKKHEDLSYEEHF